MKRRFHPQTQTGYRLMVWIFRIMDLFQKPDRRLEAFAIKKGDVVVDYGCGPGRYIEKASDLVGPDGRVLAADIQPTAIEIIRKKIAQRRLTQVVPVLLGDGGRQIDDHVADVVYALDMFHQIDDSVSFLSEIHRIIKEKGRFYLEDGHQPRSETRQKVRASNLWRVTDESKRHLVLSPL